MKQINPIFNQGKDKMGTLMFLEYPLQVTEKEVQIALVWPVINKKLKFQKILLHIVPR